jgi:putative phosphonate metabolism protein
MTPMRYAIYYLPEETSPLWRFGSAIIGYDSVSGALTDHPDLGLNLDLALLTKEPRTYGFHATLKAPFRLPQGATEAMLLEAAQSFALQQPPFALGHLEVKELGSFIALTARPNQTLRAFAADCVRAFEPFRAPMTSDERARRLRAPLTPRQVELMDAWGYPYVFEEFKFHMTLTASILNQDRTAVRDAIKDAYREVDGTASLTSLCVCIQPQGERFRLLRRFPLATPPS